MKWLVLNCGCSATLIKPVSPVCSTSGTTNSGFSRSTPFSKTRTRPGRSVKIIRPSGAQTIDHGTSKLPTTVSTLKLVCDCGECSTSPAPRPGGGELHDAARRDKAIGNNAEKIIFHFPSNISHLSFSAHCSLLTAHCSLLTAHCLQTDVFV